MESEEPEIKSKQASKRDRTLQNLQYMKPAARNEDEFTWNGGLV